jgi:hypothetical protein
LDEFAGPEVISGEGLGPIKELHELSWEVRDATGEVVAVEGFYVEDSPNRLDSAVIELVAGRTIWLPAGHYRVRNHSKWVENACATKTISSPDDCVLNLNGSFRPCQLFVRNDFGELIRGAVISINAAQEEYVHSMEWRNPLEIWLPVGAATFLVRAPGCEPIRITREIESGIDPLQVELQVAPWE